VPETAYKSSREILRRGVQGARLEGRGIAQHSVVIPGRGGHSGIARTRDVRAEIR
jgi:hypothetical protein